jgi:hypothetical protein
MLAAMSWQWWTIYPDYPERLVADVFDAVLFTERGIKGGLRADFPLSLAFDNNPGSPADEKQYLFRFLVDVVGDHAANFGDVHAHRDIINPTKLGREQELGDTRRDTIFPLNIRGFYKW